MDYIERKTVLKQAKEALEAGGVDIDQFLVACEQEIVNSREVDKKFTEMNWYVNEHCDEDIDVDRWALPKVMAEAISEGLYGQG